MESVFNEPSIIKIDGRGIEAGDIIYKKKGFSCEGYKPDICENVLIIVDGRPFSERCKCFRKGDVAYVTDEEFARML